ncbi:MAG: ABC transporter permease, partial [Lentisphaerae bacterium]
MGKSKFYPQSDGVTGGLFRRIPDLPLAIGRLANDAYGINGNEKPEKRCMQSEKAHEVLPSVQEIRPQQGWRGLNLAELYQYRELFLFLAWRDILIRYKQTLLGVLWVILQPLINVVIFTLIFGKVAKLPSCGVPYPLITLAGLIPWQFFATALSFSGMSLISSSNLISKIYFPRLIVPLSSMLACLVDSMIAFCLLMLVYFGYYLGGEWGLFGLQSMNFAPSLRLLMLPLIGLWTIVFTGGVGIWFSALNVRYRDVKYVMPYLLRIGLLVSPVGFLSMAIPQKWQLAFALNPMVGIIDALRWSLFGEVIQAQWTG